MRTNRPILTSPRQCLLLACGIAVGLGLAASCDGEPTTADAQTQDFLTAKDFQSRVYRVSARGDDVEIGDPIIEATASCEEGDTLVGGGCWAYHAGVDHLSDDPADDAGRDHIPFINGPETYFDLDANYHPAPPMWRCAYKNAYPETSGVRAHAHAICFRASE